MAATARWGATNFARTASPTTIPAFRRITGAGMIHRRRLDPIHHHKRRTTMVRVIIVLIRVFLGLLLAFFALLSAMTGFVSLAYQNAKLLGAAGALFLLGVLVAAALSTASWKLLSTTLRMASAT